MEALVQGHFFPFRIYTVTAILLSLALGSCTENEPQVEGVNTEIAQLAGDLMDSVDELTANSFSGAARTAKTGARADCSEVPFGACTDNVRTRNFGGCTEGPLTFTGTTSLTYVDDAVDATCEVTSLGHSVSRKADWIVTGARGLSVAVTSTGTFGQRITWSSEDEASWENDGIRRVARSPRGVVLTDFSMRTTSPIDVRLANTPPNQRDGLVVTGGALEITDHLNSSTCTIEPTNLTWSASCSCAVSGTVSGTCSDNRSYSVTVTGCGTGTVTVRGVPIPVTFDRCRSLSR